MIHLLHGNEIDRYFGGARDAATIRLALANVSRCGRCRRRYERHLLVERVLPDAPAAVDRLWETIAASAGGPEARAASRGFGGRAALLVAAVAGVVLVSGPSRRATEPQPPVARGGETGAPAAPTLHVYRNVGGRAEPVAGNLRGHDGLLVAYSNPSDLGYLMVFAVDGSGGVHWYYPAYARLGDDPAAVPIRARALGVELGEEIHHDLPVGSLRMVALFLPEPRRVLDVERAVAAALARAGGALDKLAGLAAPGGVEVAQSLQVVP
jgi:hypothetical protein